MSDLKDDIERYRAGLLSPAEMHALEKRALSDPFLADALEGADTISSNEFSSDARELEEKFMHGGAGIRFTPLRIAAGTILLVGVGYLIYFFNTPGETPLTLEKYAIEKKDLDSAGPAVTETQPPLITLAKPDESSVKDQSSRKASTADVTREDKVVADELSVEKAEPTDSKVAQEIVQAELEEKNKLAAAEIESQKELSSKAIQSTAGGAGETKKESADLRTARAKLVPSIQQSNNLLSGRVTDGEDGTAIPGVNITIKGSNIGTVTDSNGNYQISSPTADPLLEFSFIGMNTVEKKPGEGGKLDVRLEPDASSLSEVVVVGYGATSDKDDAYKIPVTKLAVPEIGMKAFNKYLEENLRFPQAARDAKVKGRVTVQFTVTPAGALTQFNILKGIGYGCDEELIRLVKEGPSWKPSTKDESPVSSQVKVKMKFDWEKAK